MSNPEALSLLQQIAERSPAGVGVRLATLEAEAIPAALVRDLQVEGLLELVDGSEDTVCVTEAGRDMLQPRNSL